MLANVFIQKGIDEFHASVLYKSIEFIAHLDSARLAAIEVDRAACAEPAEVSRETLISEIVLWYNLKSIQKKQE